MRQRSAGTIPGRSLYRERLIRRGTGAVWKGGSTKHVKPFGIIWKEDIWIEHRKMRIRDPERNLRILESMRKNGEEFGPREQYYYEMERLSPGDAGRQPWKTGSS